MRRTVVVIQENYFKKVMPAACDIVAKRAACGSFSVKVYCYRLTAIEKNTVCSA
jgi:hypothetical protein